MNKIKGYIQGYNCLNNKTKFYLLLYAIQSISSGVCFFIAIFLNQVLLFKADLISFVVGCYVIGNLFGSWSAGFFLDKCNPLRCCGISLACQAACFVLMVFVKSPAWFALTMLVLGAASYVYLICNNYLITSMAGAQETDRACAISLLHVASNIGIGLGGAVVSFLSSISPFFMFYSISIMLSVFSVLFFSDRSTVLYTASKSSSTRSKNSNVYFFRLSLIIIFLVGIIFAQQRVGYSLFLTTYFTHSETSFIFLLNAGLIIFFLPSVTQAAIRTNQVWTMGTGVLLLGMGMLMLQFTAGSFGLVVLLCLIATIGEMLATSLSQLLCFQNAPQKQRGKAMSHYKFCYALGTILGTFMGGKIQLNFGINIIWTVCGLLGIISLLLCVSAREALSDAVLDC